MHSYNDITRSNHLYFNIGVINHRPIKDNFVVPLEEITFEPMRSLLGVFALDHHVYVVSYVC